MTIVLFEMIVNLAEYRTKKEEEQRIKVEARQKLEEIKSARGDDYNYKFFQLVEMFMNQNYPCWSVKWDKFINENWR